MTRVVTVLVIAIAAGAVHAAPTLDLVAANGTDPRTGYGTDLPNSVAAGHAKARELDSCVKAVALDYQSPGSILVDVFLKVGSDGKAISVDTTDPSTHTKHKFASPGADCVAPIVKTWTFPDHDVVLLRFALVDVAVKRVPKLPDGYVASLAAVCAAIPKDRADLAARIAAIRAALAAHPDDTVQKMMTTLDQYHPATRAPIVRALTANAGIASCPALLETK